MNSEMITFLEDNLTNITLDDSKNNINNVMYIT